MKPAIRPSRRLGKRRVLNDVSGYIRFVDLKQLLSLATSHRIKVQVVRRVGQFVPAGTPLLMVNKAERLSAEATTAFRAAFDFGPTRTLQQDVEFGVLQIVDIALKAISPAVNDPTTAIGCVDQLTRILIRFASRDMPEPRLYDLRGVARVSIQWIDFERLLDSAFEQIRMYSKGDDRGQPSSLAGAWRHLDHHGRSGSPKDALLSAGGTFCKAVRSGSGRKS